MRAATSSSAGAAGRGSGPTSRTPSLRRVMPTACAVRSCVRVAEGEHIAFEGIKTVCTLNATHLECPKLSTSQESCLTSPLPV